MANIKLVIKIPEQIYLNAKTDTLCGADILVSAIKNGIPHETVTEFADRCRECGREKVLDKIRAEIDAHRKTIRNMAYIDDWYAGKLCGHDCDIEIIDKYRKGQE